MIRQKAISNSFFETITYVFSNKELLEKYGFETVVKSKDILNPIVFELNTFRTTMALNLVQAVSSNVKHGFKSIGFFEIGTIFNANRDETKSLSFIFSGEQEQQSISNCAKPDNIDFFSFSQKISNIIGDFELEPILDIQTKFIHPYQNANIIKDGINIGSIYKLHPSIATDFDISKDTFICEIEFDKLQNNIILAKNISKFQSSKRDLSIIAPKNLDYKKIKKVINDLSIKEIKQYNLIDIYSDKKLEDNESLTISFILQSEVKTMEETDITAIMDKILESLNKELQIGIR
jgi:phenylalanyl-tRNA synthetase beta chain